ncbi:hypothetical protein ANCDUO_03020 [Ancylostoma duodenale]|uniref:Uncharacterized protein n=1 Tax=Ancylostoma duodenale TaxID=51022 RepID=A0A0C2DUX3_9BILA|nr:hypothetical protein ANCDUO_03020 [Ancylostoma duodenale]
MRLFLPLFCETYEQLSNGNQNFTQNLSAVLSDPGRSRSEVNTFFTRHWGDSFVPPTTIPRSTLIPPISDQQFVAHQKNTGKVYKRYHATKRALAALQQPSTCGEGDSDDLPLVGLKV